MRSTQRVPTQVQTSNPISACVQAARQSRACDWQLSVGGGGGGLIPTRFCVCVFPQRRPSSPPTCAWTQPQQFRSRHSPHGEDWWTWPSYRLARCMRTCGTGKPRMATRSIHDTHGTHRTHDRAASNAMPLARSFRTSCIARVAAAHSPHHSALRLQSHHRVLIHGGAGSVGSFAVRYARSLGCHVSATSRYVLRNLGTNHHGSKKVSCAGAVVQSSWYATSFAFAFVK